MPEKLIDIQYQVTQDLLSSYQDLKPRLTIGDNKLTQAIEYSLLNGGKRLRPLLHRLVARMVNASIEDAKVCELALECIHAYSLVHDDLPCMDDDELRRGKPTTHIAFDEATAVLAGDALQTLAFEALTELPLSTMAERNRTLLIKVLARASGARGMCLGQSMDLDATDKHIKADELIELHQLKTGALLKASVDMAILLNDKFSDADKQHMRIFAESIGLAFQIQDDILDVTSDTTTLGKPQGSDASQNKSTFVAFYGLEGAMLELQKKQQQAMQCLAELEYNTTELAAFTDLVVTRSY